MRRSSRPKPKFISRVISNGRLSFVVTIIRRNSDDKQTVQEFSKLANDGGMGGGIRVTKNGGIGGDKMERFRKTDATSRFLSLRVVEIYW